VIGTKSRGVYEAPGMELLGFGLRAVYQATMDRRCTVLFQQLSRLIAEAVYEARLFDPHAQSAFAGIKALSRFATGTVQLGLYRGNMYFQALRDAPYTLYNPADASMEASDGLNPVSSQGYVEVTSCEAKNMAAAHQIARPFWR
jgi:argininosuccinate synthase